MMGVAVMMGDVGVLSAVLLWMLLFSRERAAAEQSERERANNEHTCHCDFSFLAHMGARERKRQVRKILRVEDSQVAAGGIWPFWAVPTG
jgi:hypothetical protein